MKFRGMHHELETRSWGDNIPLVGWRARLTCFWIAHKTQKKIQQNDTNFDAYSIANMLLKALFSTWSDPSRFRSLEATQPVLYPIWKPKGSCWPKPFPLEDTNDYREQSINEKGASIKRKNKTKHPMNGWEESDENEIQECDSDANKKAMRN